MIQEIQDYVRRKIYNFTRELDSPVVKAQLAELRRGAGKKPGELPQLWGSFLCGIPQELIGRTAEPSAAEWSIYTTLTLYALHQQGNSDNVYDSGREYSFGRAAGKLVGSEDDVERIRKRFASAALADDMCELSYHLRNIIALMKSENIKIDYADLAKDIFLFQNEDHINEIRLKWGRDFYREISAKKEN